MQETALKSRESNRLESANNRSYWRIKDDIDKFNQIQAETFKLILDEEKTHAAEILAQYTKSGDIPRIYFKKADDLVDGHGVSLKNVLDGGIRALEQADFKKPGSQWELRRRQIERQNLDILTNLEIGQIAVEVSPTDFTKSHDELISFGYTGSTLVRVTHRQNMDKYVQRNIILNDSSLDFINDIRRLINEKTETINSAEEALANVSIINGGLDEVNELAASFKIADANKNELKSAFSFVKQTVKNNLYNQINAWDFIENNDDVLVALVQSFKDLQPDVSVDGSIDNLRAGAWRILIERLNNQDVDKSVDIIAGSQRAIESGMTFVACGGVVDLVGLNALTSRISTYFKLYNNIYGFGICTACDDKNFLYGCGVFCFDCNSIWCDEYLISGLQLDKKDLLEKRYRKYGRY